MQAARKQQKRRRSFQGGRYGRTMSYDLVEVRTEKGRKLRMLVVIDEFTRET